jgi:hypothetical protein
MGSLLIVEYGRTVWDHNLLKSMGDHMGSLPILKSMGISMGSQPTKEYMGSYSMGDHFLTLWIGYRSLQRFSNGDQQGITS